MYQRFRIWVDSDMAEQLNQRPINVPPSPPETANLQKADAPRIPDTQRNGHESGRGEEFDARDGGRLYHQRRRPASWICTRRLSASTNGWA